MALTDLKRKGNILRVIDPVPMVKGGDRCYWYINLDTWQISTGGKKGDVPKRPMTREEITRVKEKYLPRL